MQRQRIPHARELGAALVVLGVGAAFLLPRLGGEAPGVSFSRQIQPIFTSKCAQCHPVSYPYLDLRPGRSYDELVRVPAATRPAFERVLPGRPELSYLLTHPPDPDLRDLLTDAERALIARWIEEGARRN